MRIAYLDCIGGISGDMALAALLDAGADREALVRTLRTLPLPPWELRAGSTRKHSLAAATVEVLVEGVAAGAAPLLRLPPRDDPAPPRETGHTHSHGEHSHAHGEHTHSHGEHSHAHGEHSHAHGEHSHAHGEHSHAHGGGAAAPEPASDSGAGPPRTLKDVEQILLGGELPPAVVERAVAVYRRLAGAEAEVHGVAVEEVHFHEVGAVDSIVDVAGTVLALHLLGVERVVCSPLPVSGGEVPCAHGRMPAPAPATLLLLRGCRVRRAVPGGLEGEDLYSLGELVTPTGAALATELAAEFGPLPDCTIVAVGTGAGKKDLPFPNVLRAVVGEVSVAPRGPSGEATEVVLLETNLDDLSPQLFEPAMDALLAAGALDVWVTPILMKKGRPAHRLTVLCEPEARAMLARILFVETGTLGVRYTPWHRETLAREWVEVPTPYGTVRVKVGRYGGEVMSTSPEFEDCRVAAQRHRVPVRQVLRAAQEAAARLQLPGARR